MNSSETTNNQLLAEGIAELENLKSQIVRLSAQEAAFRGVAASVKDIEKAVKALEKKLTETVTTSNKKMAESVSIAAEGLDSISATNEKIKWRITWGLLGLFALAQIAITIIILFKL